MEEPSCHNKTCPCASLSSEFSPAERSWRSRSDGCRSSVGGGDTGWRKRRNHLWFGRSLILVGPSHTVLSCLNEAQIFSLLPPFDLLLVLWGLWVGRWRRRWRRPYSGWRSCSSSPQVVHRGHASLMSCLPGVCRTISWFQEGSWWPDKQKVCAEEDLPRTSMVSCRRTPQRTFMQVPFMLNTEYTQVLVQLLLQHSVPRRRLLGWDDI